LQNSAPSGAAKAATKVSKKESSSDEDDGSSDESSDDEEESEPTKTPKKKVWLLKPFCSKIKGMVVILHNLLLSYLCIFFIWDITVSLILRKLL